MGHKSIIWDNIIILIINTHFSMMISGIAIIVMGLANFIGYYIVPDVSLTPFAGVFVLLKLIQSANDIGTCRDIIVHAGGAGAAVHIIIFGI